MLRITFLLVCAPLLLVAIDPAAQAPEVFGPGVLSEGEIFRGSFSPDGQTFYFFKKVTPGEEDYRIFVSHQRAGGWSKPERLLLGGDFSDLYPAVSPDGSRMIFSSYRPAPGDFAKAPNAYLWSVGRQGDAWGRPVFLETLNRAGFYHASPTVDSTGTVHFRRVSPDWDRRESFVSVPRSGVFQPPVLSEAIEASRRSRPDLVINGGVPGPTPDLYFLDVGAGEGRATHSDIWVTRKVGTNWSDPAPLGPAVNTNEFDNFPFFSPDGRDLYFVRGFRTFYRMPLAAALIDCGKCGG